MKWLWEWYSKDYNCAPVGRVRHVHWDFDKAENKDISEVTIFHAFRLPPKDNSRLTLDPSLQWISGVCPDVSIKTYVIFWEIKRREKLICKPLRCWGRHAHWEFLIDCTTNKKQCHSA